MRARRDITPEEHERLRRWVDLQYGRGEVSFRAVRGKGKWLLLLQPHTERNVDVAFAMVADEDLEYPTGPRGRRELDSPERRKAIHRVQQLLRLAEGNANPNEERVARRAARRIMRQYEITPSDLRSQFRARVHGGVRDVDYRGKSTTVDWSKLAYLARRKKPGALEVLQDAIELYFPKQFKKAQAEARRESKDLRGEEVYVNFDGRVARRRFEPRKTHKRTVWTTGARGTHAKTQRAYVTLKHPMATPFSIMTRGEYLEYENETRLGHRPPPVDTIVWSTVAGKNIGSVR